MFGNPCPEEFRGHGKQDLVALQAFDFNAGKPAAENILTQISPKLASDRLPYLAGLPLVLHGFSSLLKIPAD